MSASSLFSRRTVGLLSAAIAVSGEGVTSALAAPSVSARPNVITIDEPPEYVIEGAVQRRVVNATSDEDRNEKFRQSIHRLI